MKIFLSWSGDRSKAVATALRSWIPDIIQTVQPWMSQVDIDAGSRWSGEMNAQMEEAKFGVLCLTRDNQTAPWILFEAGALCPFGRMASAQVLLWPTPFCRRDTLFLPPYCPELNLIEILWRKIKYEWLPVSAYQSFKDLTEALDEVLRGVGSKYRLSFAH